MTLVLFSKFLKNSVPVCLYSLLGCQGSVMNQNVQDIIIVIRAAYLVSMLCITIIWVPGLSSVWCNKARDNTRATRAPSSVQEKSDGAGITYINGLSCDRGNEWQWWHNIHIWVISNWKWNEPYVWGIGMSPVNSSWPVWPDDLLSPPALVMPSLPRDRNLITPG